MGEWVFYGTIVCFTIHNILMNCYTYCLTQLLAGPTVRSCEYDCCKLWCTTVLGNCALHIVLLFKRENGLRHRIGFRGVRRRPLTHNRSHSTSSVWRVFTYGRMSSHNDPRKNTFVTHFGCVMHGLTLSVCWWHWCPSQRVSKSRSLNLHDK